MLISRRFVAEACFLFVWCAVTGCSDLPVASADVADARVARLEATTPAQQVSDANGTPALLPAVIVRDAQGAPLPNVRVHFDAIGPQGDTVTQQRLSDDEGRAAMPAWRLGVPARYLTQVRAGSLPGVTFSVVAMPQVLRDSSMRARCPLSDSLRVPFTRLDTTLARLRSGRPLRIVAYGSSSTAGEGASQVSLGYVEQTAVQLRRAFPASSITMVNAGLTGAGAPDMERRLDAAVLAQDPQLVILQSATIEAIRLMPIDSLRLPLTRMLERLQSRGVEVILLDSQRYRGIGGGPVYREFQSVLRSVGATFGISTARRFLWYDEMIDQQRYTFDQLLSWDNLHPTDLGHGCTATVLSTGIVAAMLGELAPA